MKSDSKTACNAPWSRVRRGWKDGENEAWQQAVGRCSGSQRQRIRPSPPLPMRLRCCSNLAASRVAVRAAAPTSATSLRENLSTWPLRCSAIPLPTLRRLSPNFAPWCPRNGACRSYAKRMRGFAPGTVPEDSIPILPGATLGEALDAYVASAAEGRIEAHPMLMLKFVGSLFRPPDWVEMIDDPFGRAPSCMYISPKYISKKYSSSFVTGAQITREIIIGSGLLDTLIAICRDSISTSSGKALAGAKPERKNAGFLAGKPTSKPSRRKQPEASTSELTRSGHPPSTDPGVIRRCEK